MSALEYELRMHKIICSKAQILVIRVNKRVTVLLPILIIISTKWFMQGITEKCGVFNKKFLRVANNIKIQLKRSNIRIIKELQQT